MKLKSFTGIPMLTLLTLYLILSGTDNGSRNGLISGRDLFRLNCSGCHGENRAGNPPAFPSLIEIDRKMTQRDIIDQIKAGKNIMPSFSHLSEVQIDAIVEFVYSGEEKMMVENIRNPGEMLVQSNCVRCHRLTASDPRPADARWMEPAHLSGVDNRFSFADFSAIVENGRCYMPSFSHFDEAEKEKIYQFLQTLKVTEDESDANIAGCWRRKRDNSRNNRRGCR